MNARLRSLPTSLRFLMGLRSRPTSTRFSQHIAMPSLKPSRCFKYNLRNRSFGPKSDRKSAIGSDFRFQISQKNKNSSPKLTKIVSRMVQIVFRATQGRSLAPGGRPGASQPLSQGALGRYPGPSESYVLRKENIDFPLLATGANLLAPILALCAPQPPALSPLNLLF